MKIKTNNQSGVGLIGWLIIVGLVIVVNIGMGVVWYFRPITGTPLPLPGKPLGEQGGFIPIPVETPACNCGNHGGLCEVGP